MAWRMPAEAITTVAQVSFMDVVCAAGQFMARASSFVHEVMAVSRWRHWQKGG